MQSFQTAVIGLKDPNKQTKIKQKNLLQKYFSSFYHSLKWTSTFVDTQHQQSEELRKNLLLHLAMVSLSLINGLTFPLGEMITILFHHSQLITSKCMGWMVTHCNIMAISWIHHTDLFETILGARVFCLGALSLTPLF